MDAAQKTNKAPAGAVSAEAAVAELHAMILSLVESGFGPAATLAFVFLYASKAGVSLPALVQCRATDLAARLGQTERSARRWIETMEALDILVPQGGHPGWFQLHDPRESAGRPRAVGRRDPQRVLFAEDQAGPVVQLVGADTCVGTGAGTGADTCVRSDTRVRPAHSLSARARVPRPGPGPRPGPPEVGQGNGRTGRDLERDLLAEAPELREAAVRPVEPLPAGRLAYGVFAPLKDRDLASPLRVVQWFRMQMGAPRPAIEGTEAGLLLVLAAARYASGLPKKEIIKTRAAAFVRMVSRHHWRLALPELPAARRDLDELVRVHPDLLTGPTWPRPAETAGDAAPDQAAGDVGPDQAAGDDGPVDPDVATYAAKLERELAARRAVAARQGRGQPGRTSEGGER